MHREIPQAQDQGTSYWSQRTPRSGWTWAGKVGCLPVAGENVPGRTYPSRAAGRKLGRSARSASCIRILNRFESHRKLREPCRTISEKSSA